MHKVNTKIYFNSPPIVVGGVGGSGTRVVAKMVESLGFFMGDDLNHAYDNMRLASRFKEIRSRVSGLPDGSAEIDDILVTFERDMHEGFLAQTDKRAGWGWKVPANFLILPQLVRRFGQIRYIHVIRHGLDMAFSSNQNQTRNLGCHFGINADVQLLPQASLAYWIRANTFAFETARQLEIPMLVLNFDRLCNDTQAVVEDIIVFLKADEQHMSRLAALVESPASIGRYQNENLSFVTEADRLALSSLGFEVNLK
jgi:hypothetical protein